MPLQLVVRHRDDGQDQVDEVKRSEKDVGHEEDDVPRAGRAKGDLVEVLPEVLSHQTEGTEVGLSKGIETRVAVVRVGPEPLDAGCTQGALSCTRRVSAHDVGARVRVDVPRAFVVRPVGPVLV